mmetsp:Transcript_10193/g.27201  ORF Transcript_10193/g.27201 Transcript_10193/m.27201 type:complete len:105 (-) Transcript_10193:678-992(-)
MQACSDVSATVMITGNADASRSSCRRKREREYTPGCVEGGRPVEKKRKRLASRGLPTREFMRNARCRAEYICLGRSYLSAFEGSCEREMVVKTFLEQKRRTEFD